MSKDAPNGRRLRNDVQALLDSRCKRRKFRLKVTATELDDDWTLVMVRPTRVGVRVYDWIEVLSEVEKKLKAKGYDRVLLLPALPG